MVERHASAPEVIRLAMEVIEQAPAEALYVKLLRTLSEAGMEADLRGAAEAARKIALAYKLTVELGGKLGVLSQEHLDRHRTLAAALFSEHEVADFDPAHGPANDHHQLDQLPAERPFHSVR